MNIVRKKEIFKINKRRKKTNESTILHFKKTKKARNLTNNSKSNIESTHFPLNRKKF